MGSFSRSGPVNEKVQAVTPTTGQTIVVAAGTTALLINPAGTLAALTVTLPASPVDGQTITIATSQIITALTVNGTKVGALTTLALGGYAYYVYGADGAKWFRCG